MPLAVMVDKDPPSPKLLGFTLVVASRHRKERSNPFMTDLCKICFKKKEKHIHFIPNHLPDNKRQQTTAVDYKRLFNGLFLTRVASLQRKTTYIMETGKENEIVLYQPNEMVKLEVRVQEDSVWLTQQQIADLFGTKRPAITKHLKNIYSSGELEESSTCSILELMGNDGKQMYSTKFYNLDAILSVGYRVNSINATAFRRWANQVVKEYLLRGYAVRQQLQAFKMQLDARFDEQSNRIRLLEEKTDIHSEKIDFFIRTNLPPVEGVLFEGQVLDARLFAENLIKTAQHEVILIDNYIDASDFDILECRNENVDATIFVERITPALLVLQTDCLVQTGRKTELRTTRTRVHDRFLIIDSQVYHLGASLKDLGRKLFAFSKMGLDKELLLGQVI